MTIKVAIHHETTYRFDRLTRIMPHEIRLRPAPHSRTPIHAYSLKVWPEEHFINWQQDPFSNYLARLVFPEPAHELRFSVEVIADMTVINPFDFFLNEDVEHYPFKYSSQLKKDLAPYLQIMESGPLLTRWMKAVSRKKQATIPFVTGLNHRLQQDISYLIRMEPGVQTCEQTLERGSGSCRDTAWLLVQILRHLGLAARFVSGYLVQLTADQKALDGPSGTDKDFTDLHAWTEVYIPGAGWIGLDPTSGLLAAEGHIPLACTPDPFSAAPVTGSTSPCEVDFSFTNSVTRIHEDPRVTKPYSEEQWQQIFALGEAVDRRLAEHDVRLTMGGEPTFVSIDDMDGAQWNTQALGEEKQRLAGQLLQRLRQTFGPEGLTLHGQGKWYPGEPLPRWAMSLIWRNDGRPLWKAQELLIPASSSGDCPREASRHFLEALAERLGLSEQRLMPAYEDVEQFLDEEGQQPADIDLRKIAIDSPGERKRLRRLIDQGLKQVSGYVLPLGWEGPEDDGHWISSPWPFRRGRLFLLPGDSPLGFRLPLNSLPWEIERHVDPERDPFAPDTPLPEGSATQKGRVIQEKVVHTALCTEVRDGKLHVFLPPLSHLGPWLHLLDAIEQVAVTMDQPLILEGYEPPRDARLRKLMITPDPGVIEVNIHPADNWEALVNNTRILYEEARLCRLGTEKFMLDGRHTGTGGGNHITVGAARPEDSPFLRRPQLLASLLRFWQNHPSLSYLFSGQFIGPTSQAPRVDEARDDHLYELEIALQQLPTGHSEQPWVIDRILRNFLVDLTGNTHRSEFCIDKLFSPDSASGRLGLVEFRNFEMPPHWQMSLVQGLLLRSLIAWFWEHPYEEPFTYWGTQLHDRYMLPYFVGEDLDWVIRDLRQAGYPLEWDWFSPFQEFRFPHYGTFHAAGVEVSLRSAIEPWHVLGEESSSQGMARYVDSSVERLQVLVRGLHGQRLVLCCNGRKVPLQATGREGEFVAGIRYKAWAPWSALHPTIDVHTPLVFDLVDTFNQRSLGGCRYHVSHPGGRNYDTFPVNANEAEARRVARFTTQGHTQGYFPVQTEQVHPHCPATLDLRYQPGR